MLGRGETTGFGETMDALGIEGEPTMAGDYPTVTVLAKGVSDELHARVGTSDG
jgi:hypothetical protein